MDKDTTEVSVYGFVLLCLYAKDDLNDMAYQNHKCNALREHKIQLPGL